MPQSYSTGAGGGQDRQAGGTGTGGGSQGNGGNNGIDPQQRAQMNAAAAAARMAAASRPQEQNTYAAAPSMLNQMSSGQSLSPFAQQGGGAYYPDYTPPNFMDKIGNFLPSNAAAGWLGDKLGTDSYVGGALNAYSNFNPTSKFVNQTRYGMNDAARTEYLRQEQTNPNWANMSESDRVSLARKPYMDANNNYTGPQKPSNFSDQQWNSMTQGQRQFMSPEGSFGGQAGMSNQGGQSGAGGMMNQTNMGGSRDYSGAEGTFKPVTFRSGSMGQGDPYAGLSDMAQQGQGLFGQAAAQAQQAPDQFNYNFNPEQAGQDLFNQRAELLQPQFAQQNAQAQESMFGTGRLGLRLAGEGIGAGAGSGMMSPDAFGVNAAQSQALAGLAAQSTNDAFGQELQRSGLDLSQFNANQMTQQQQYANLMGTGQGMLSGSMMEPEIRNQLIAQQQQQQALDQNYELGLYGNETARITGQAQADRANYQPDPWLSGLTSLGTSFLGSEGGSGWLSGIFKGIS